MRSGMHSHCHQMMIQAWPKALQVVRGFSEPLLAIGGARQGYPETTFTTCQSRRTKDQWAPVAADTVWHAAVARLRPIPQALFGCLKYQEYLKDWSSMRVSALLD